MDSRLFCSVGPHLFQASDAPHYSMAFMAIMISYALVLSSVLGLRGYLSWFNRRRDAVEGADVSNTLVREDTSETALLRESQEDVQDTSDLKTAGFRYRM